MEYYDNTRVEAWKNCPRKYYFRHVRGWRRDGVGIPLVFGSAMHAAMDCVWGSPGLSAPRLTRDAYEIFMDEWLEGGMTDEMAAMDKKRNPGNAKNIVASYVLEWQNWLREVEVLAIEQPFIVPLFDGVGYIGRWDKIHREKSGRIYVSDHKTTSLYRVATKFETNWLQSWSPNAQVDGYVYAAIGVYGEKVKGCIIDGILVHPKVRAFRHIPIQRSYTNLDAWHYETVHWIREIQENMKILGTGRSRREYLPCFPKKDTHCQHKYGVCTYHDICRFGPPNPEEMESPPSGFVVDKWSPFDHNTQDGVEPLTVGEGSV